MKVAHLAVITPKRCGLYETTREIVAALRAAGADSRMVDPTKATNKLYPKGTEDRGAPFAEMDWAVEADIVVSHSGYDSTPIEKTKQPIVYLQHGRPRSSFMTEAQGSTPIYSYYYRMNAEPRLRAVVTLWPEHLPYLRFMMPDKPVHAVQSCVDLEAWTPNGPSGYGFHGKKGAINAVCTDAFRLDVDPFIPLQAFGLWAREHREARAHLYAKPKDAKGWNAIIKRLMDDGAMGEVVGWVDGLAHVYRAASFLMTAHTIATRSVREAMACGCPVVRVPALANGYADRMTAALAIGRAQVRKWAEERFDPKVTARQLKAILESV